MHNEQSTEYLLLLLSDSSTSAPQDSASISITTHPKPAAESKWGVGWRTLSSIVFFYILALVIAATHLAVFQKLDGRLTDEEGLPPQTYIAALSTFLVNAFGTSLVVCLGVAFTQYLWHLFRTQPMTVSDVETLYGMQSNPFALLSWSLWTGAPIVCLTASTILLLSIAKIFPPGALTVVTRNFTSTPNHIVPTFKPDCDGDAAVSMELLALFAYMDDISWYEYLYGFFSFSLPLDLSNINRGLDPLLARVTENTLSMGEVMASTSPCGPNCTYHIAFEGPYFQCKLFTRIVLESPYTIGGYTVYKYYSSGYSPDTMGDQPPWYTPDPLVRPKDEKDEGNITVAFPHFIMEVRHPIGLQKSTVNTTYELVSNMSHLQCQPATVTYQLNVSFNNGIRSLSNTLLDDIRLLSDIPNLNATLSDLSTDTEAETPPIEYRISLRGVRPMIVFSDQEKKNETKVITLTNGTQVEVEQAGPMQFSLSQLGGLDTDKSTIGFTRFNKNRDKPSAAGFPDLENSVEILNNALANATISALHTYLYWNTTENATILTSRTFYSFSNPISLYLSYGISLLIALPFAILGVVALHKNGVTALGSSFLQVLMTTTASQRLNMIAAGGALGGDENIPSNLKDARILFGELDSSPDRDSTVKRAGFGFDDEVVPLRKGGRPFAEP
ncbi:hypothetical protein B0T10DRAFT_590166 [Thelonectria olida]|uniref:Uncharacterized protein n=1 Tax=Thelonectria olida TaxID=1576542 RepID=A0A9P9AT42_9HYPO|nr:hypothetical protein B0T10DRAFT_590166 [Thelonectria olida]